MIHFTVNGNAPQAGSLYLRAIPEEEESVIAAVGLGAACVCLVMESVRFGRKICKGLASN